MSRLPHFQLQQSFLSLHQSFIAPNASKLNPLSYATFSLLAASQQPSTSAALSFLQSVEGAVKDDAQARLMLMMEQTRYRLKQGEVEECKRRVEEGQKLLDSYSGVMAAELYSLYYRTRCELADRQQEHNDFYAFAVLFLTYTPLSAMTEAEQADWALRVSLAALVGSRVYNFGQLLQHPVLQSLQSTPHAWLAGFLSTFNSGDMAQFNSMLVSACTAQPLLAAQSPFLQQKIRVMALVDLVFRTPARERVFSFDSIARVCEIEREQVEWLVMKALALQVIKGRIDEVAAAVSIGWVQARVLDMQQIRVLRDRLGEWRKQVKEGEIYVEQHAREIITAVPA